MVQFFNFDFFFFSPKTISALQTKVGLEAGDAADDDLDRDEDDDEDKDFRWEFYRFYRINCEIIVIVTVRNICLY